jgi:deoxyadenosine/deoxycytidine kinase
MAFSNYRRCTGCARNGCSQTSNVAFALASNNNDSNKIARTDEDMNNLLFKPSGKCLCESHAREYLNLFPTNAGQAFRYEYNPSEKTIDYVSLAKLPSRAPQRVISFKPVEDKFVLCSVLVNGEEVSAAWRAELVQGFENVGVEDIATPVASFTPVSPDPARDQASTPVAFKSANDFQTPEHTRASDCYRSAAVTAIRDAFFAKECKPSFAVKTADESNLLKVISGIESLTGARVSSFSPRNLPRSRSSSSVGTCFLDNGEEAPVVLVSIEGNIGAGKSTILNALRKSHPNWNYIDEPLDTWTSLKNEEGTNLLECFYADQRRWSYTFQNCAVLSRFRNIEKAIKEKGNGISNIFITERCLDTDYQVFAKMLVDDKNIDALEFTLYERWFNLLKETATPLSAIVYIDTPPDVCKQRIIGRGRAGEDGIPLDYLNKLTLFQNRWIDTLCADDNTSKSNVKSSASASEFPCIRATELNEIENFILTLQATAIANSRCNSAAMLRNISGSPEFMSSNLDAYVNSTNKQYANEVLLSCIDETVTN